MRWQAHISGESDTGAQIIVLEIQNILGKRCVRGEVNRARVFGESNQVARGEGAVRRGKQLNAAGGVNAGRILTLIRRATGINQGVQRNTASAGQRGRIAGVGIGHGAQQRLCLCNTESVSAISQCE